MFTLPAAIADIAYQNKAVIYDLLFKASSETMLRIPEQFRHRLMVPMESAAAPTLTSSVHAAVKSP